MTKDDDDELARLNAAVDAALAARTAFLDSKMAQYAVAQVGEYVYDLSLGRKLGKVTRHYRYWTSQNVLYDRHLLIDYDFQADPDIPFVDNTSRQNVIVGSHAQYIQHLEATLRSARK